MEETKSNWIRKNTDIVISQKCYDKVVGLWRKEFSPTKAQVNHKVTESQPDGFIMEKVEPVRCQTCSYLEEKRHITDDDFEMAYEWYCGKKNNKKIDGYIEWHEVKNVPVPAWCPKL